MKLWIVRCCRPLRRVGRTLLPPLCVDLLEQIDENQFVPTNESTNMLEPDQWVTVLGRITGTVYRGTERISSNALLNLLGVDADPVTRQKVAKRGVSGSNGWKSNEVASHSGDWCHQRAAQSRRAAIEAEGQGRYVGEAYQADRGRDAEDFQGKALSGCPSC
jgi:hypothetical protein